VGAFSAGIFHLMTHAFFKSLLFLAAGSVIHALAGEQDMRRMGGLKSIIPKTFLVSLAGALAISGIPGFSGFFSKDEILTSAFAGGHYVVWALGLAGAGMTAFYMFRLIFLTFYGQARWNHGAGLHPHESPRVMIRPLQILAVLAVVGGLVSLPPVLGGGAWLAGFLEPSTGSAEAHLSGGTEVLLMMLSAGVALAAVGAAYIVYVKRGGEPARRLAEKLKGIYGVVVNKYFVDDFYNGLFVGGVLALGRAAAWFDEHVLDGLVNGVASLARRLSRLSIGFDSRVVDGAVNGVGRVHLLVSSGLRRLQTGYLYNYALAVVLGLVILIALAVTIL